MQDTNYLPPPPEDGQYRVLIIDDDPLIARLVMTNLERSRLNCRAATDGIDGMIQFKEFQPHLVISDIMMPGMDGRQLCSTLREMSMVPIILMTAADTSEAELASFKAGADDYIPKPFDPTLMMTRVIAALRRVYRYDVQAQDHSQKVVREQAKTADEVVSQQLMICNTCGHMDAQSAFRQENSRGQRFMKCPLCQENKNFTYPKRS